MQRLSTTRSEFGAPDKTSCVWVEQPFRFHDDIAVVVLQPVGVGEVGIDSDANMPDVTGSIRSRVKTNLVYGLVQVTAEETQYDATCVRGV